MVIDPQKAQKWLKLSPYSKIQQSGIDVSLKSLSKVIVGKFCSGTAIPALTEPVEWESYIENDMLAHINPGAYDFECNEWVSVPEDCIAILVQRSSLNRCGAFITTGLYDNGFNNYIGGILHVEVPLVIEKNIRIAQIVFFRTEHKAQYNGRYQSKQPFRASKRLHSKAKR